MTDSSKRITRIPEERTNAALAVIALLIDINFYRPVLFGDGVTRIVLYAGYMKTEQYRDLRDGMAILREIVSQSRALQINGLVATIPVCLIGRLGDANGQHVPTPEPANAAGWPRARNAGLPRRYVGTRWNRVNGGPQ